MPACTNRIVYSYPIRRLTITGNDTPENFAILLGPRWKKVSETIKEMRLVVLTSDQEGICPPEGSETYNLARTLDEGNDVWAPRPASDDEKRDKERVLKAKEVLKEDYGEVSRISLNTIYLMLRECGVPRNRYAMRMAFVALNNRGQDWRHEDFGARRMYAEARRTRPGRTLRSFRVGRR